MNAALLQILASRVERVAEVRRSQYDRSPTSSKAESFYAASLILESLASALDDAAKVGLEAGL